MTTNYDARFGDCDKVARTFHGLSYDESLEGCVRWKFVGCKECPNGRKSDCDALMRYDASVEWLQEEANG